MANYFNSLRPFIYNQKMKKVAEENSGFKEAPQKKPSSGSFFWPLFLVLIGFLLLLNNFELLPWSIWNTLFRFWPVILILIGLEILLGRSRTTNALISLIGILIVAIILYTAIPQIPLMIQQFISQTPALQPK